MTQNIPDRLAGGAVDLSHLAQGAGAAQAAGQPGGAAGNTIEVDSLIVDVTEQNFEQVAQISGAVPVVFALWAQWSEPSKALCAVLESVTAELAGRVLLAKADVDVNPQLAQAFQAQSVPTVVALIGGRPVPLFQGAVPEEQVRELFAQLLQLGEQQGLQGRLALAGETPEADAEPPVNPAHADALEAIERGDFAGAVGAYEQVLLKAPADHEARAALVQVKLLDRLSGHDAETVRAQAAAAPTDVEAQLRVADLDISGGHVEDAFLRVLDLFAAQTEDAERTVVRERLLELFEVVGNADPRVAAARGRLANLLY